MTEQTKTLILVPLDMRVAMEHWLNTTQLKNPVTVTEVSSGNPAGTFTVKFCERSAKDDDAPDAAP